MTIAAIPFPRRRFSQIGRLCCLTGLLAVGGVHSAKAQPLVSAKMLFAPEGSENFQEQLAVRPFQRVRFKLEITDGGMGVMDVMGIDDFDEGTLVDVEPEDPMDPCLSAGASGAQTCMFDFGHPGQTMSFFYVGTVALQSPGPLRHTITVSVDNVPQVDAEPNDDLAVLPALSARLLYAPGNSSDFRPQLSVRPGDVVNFKLEVTDETGMGVMDIMGIDEFDPGDYDPPTPGDMCTIATSMTIGRSADGACQFNLGAGARGTYALFSTMIAMSAQGPLPHFLTLSARDPDTGGQVDILSNERLDGLTLLTGRVPIPDLQAPGLIVLAGLLLLALWWRRGE
jgi:hypothetical protein